MEALAKLVFSFRCENTQREERERKENERGCRECVRAMEVRGVASFLVTLAFVENKIDL